MNHPRPTLVTAYVVTAIVLGSFASTLAATAICYAMELNYQTRFPVEIAASIVGFIAAAFVAIRFWVTRGTKVNFLLVLTFTWAILTCGGLIGLALGGTP